MILPVHTFIVERGIEREDDFRRNETADRGRLAMSREESS